MPSLPSMPRRLRPAHGMTTTSKLIGQKVSATMTVLGTDGLNPGGDQPSRQTTVTVVLTGVNGTAQWTAHSTRRRIRPWQRLCRRAFGEDYTLTVSGYGYIGSLTGPDDFNAANAGVEFWGSVLLHRRRV